MVKPRPVNDARGLIGEHLGHSQVVVAEVPFSFEDRDAEYSDGPASDS